MLQCLVKTNNTADIDEHPTNMNPTSNWENSHEHTRQPCASTLSSSQKKSLSS